MAGINTKTAQNFHRNDSHNVDKEQEMTDEQLRQIARYLLYSVPNDRIPVRARIYGSRARGDADAWSDLDVLIEIRTSVDQTVKQIVRERAWELSLTYDILISPVVVSEADFETGPLARSGFAQNVLREGIEVAA